MPGCMVIADAPVFALDVDTGSPQGQTSRVQIAKTGRFWDPRYGRFAITREDFAKWVANFQRFNLADGRAGLPVDVDHGPEKRGQTEAAGWITALDTKGSGGSSATPDELWATVKWNQLGVELVSERRYLYLSPSYVADFRDEGGKQHGTAMVGVALTNRPFLRMPTISLSQAMDAVAVGAWEVQEAEDAATGTPMLTFSGSGFYTSDQANSSGSWGTFTLSPLTTTADSGSGDDRSHAMGDSPRQMPQMTTTILSRLGLGEDADEAAVLAKLDELGGGRTLDELARAEGKMVLDQAAFDTLSKQATAGVEANKRLDEMAFDAAWSKALTEGRATPAMRDNFYSLYEVNRQLTLDTIEKLEQSVNVTPTGSGGSPSGSPAPSVELERGWGSADDDRVALDARTQALMAERKLEYGDALMLAAQEMGVS